MTTQGRSNALLTRARTDPTFRAKLITLGRLGDRMTRLFRPAWEQLGKLSGQDDSATPGDAREYQAFFSLMLEVAIDAGLVEKDMNQNAFQELHEWFVDSAGELAFYVDPLPRLRPTNSCQTPVGHVFLSWSVKMPRDREAMCGIRNALDWFHIEYFDYTEHQLDDVNDRSEEIADNLDQAISKSLVSVESVSGETLCREWIDTERHLIRSNERIHRYLLCLEGDHGPHVPRKADYDKSRVTRIDASGGHSGRREDAAATEFFRSSPYLELCYDLALSIRWRLSGDTEPSKSPSFLGTLKKMVDESKFIFKATRTHAQAHP